MDGSRLLRHVIGIILLVIVFLAGYGSLATAESPTLTPPGQLTAQPGLFKFIRTVQVTPDDTFSNGSFVRVNYVPATDRLAVTFATKAELHPQPGNCKGAGHAYKEYTTDMQETGKSGTLIWITSGGPDSCEAGDWGSVMVDNTFYLVGGNPWHLTKFDAATWEKLAAFDIPLKAPQETPGDPTVAYLNGQLDVSSEYNDNPSGTFPPTDEGAATHHHFLSTELKLLGTKLLKDTPHICGSSMIAVDGITYFITADSYGGNVIVMKYDKDWNYLGMKKLISEANWSTGVAFDGQRFYLVYQETKERSSPHLFPYYPNVHLAAFDRDWNLVDDVAVTNYTPQDDKGIGRPGVLLHGNRLYVSYDLDTRDPVTHAEHLELQAVVSVYELNPAFSPPPTQQSATPPTPAPGQSTAQASTCGGDQVSPLGVLRSSDHGATWKSLGNACMRDSTVWAVDPTGFRIGDRIVLYFVDFNSLQRQEPHSIYRATAGDDLHFDKPQAVYTQPRMMVDQFVLPLADGSFRLYVPSDQEGIISAVSRDGLAFTRENGVRATDGGMPGALLLPDNQVRMFLAGGNDGKEGIFSKISKDGLNFTVERGVRIEAPPNSIADNPQPIRLLDGTYLMLYQIHDRKYEGLPPWEHTEIHLATSGDGFNWTTNPTVIGYGGTSCVIELQDGTLLIYYVNR